MDEAARAYLHDRLGGEDTLLMCGTEAMAAELSRRIRGDLIHWGIVDGHGPAVTLMNGYEASAGDWVMARQNRNDVDAGEQGRALANRDVLRIVQADARGDGLWVRVERFTGRDPATGAEQWSAPFEMHRSYFWNCAHLAYAVTFHAAEGRTVDSGIAVFTGAEDRQAVTVAMTRGRDANHAYVITGWVGGSRARRRHGHRGEAQGHHRRGGSRQVPGQRRTAAVGHRHPGGGVVRRRPARRARLPVARGAAAGQPTALRSRAPWRPRR